MQAVDEGVGWNKRIDRDREFRLNATTCRRRYRFEPGSADQHGACLSDENSSRLGQRWPESRPVEQRDFLHVLQRSDRLADRRLRATEPASCGGKASSLGNCYQDAKLIEPEATDHL